MKSDEIFLRHILEEIDFLLRREPLGDTGKKLGVVRAAARHAFPTGEIGEILAEIERGYGGESSR